MRECSYEVYVSTFTAVREGLAAGDRDVVSRTSQLVARKTGVGALVVLLALIEASRGEARREKADVCNGVLCNRGCGSSREPA